MFSEFECCCNIATHCIGKQHRPNKTTKAADSLEFTAKTYQSERHIPNLLEAAGNLLSQQTLFN